MAGAQTKAPIRVQKGSNPLMIDVSTRIDGAVIDQAFLVPAPSRGRLPAPGVLNDIACNGTTARLLTPLFGGGRKTPLRIALKGRGRIIVSANRPGHRVWYQRLFVGRGQSAVASISAGRLSHGLWNIAISTSLAGKPERIVLSAFRV
ncbi:MAG: hypothetical protein JO372_06785 [Solirubrobacterales bacterium]|nr:hypothetical protein [Solirubrobacterales bacterium]